MFAEWAFHSFLHFVNLLLLCGVTATTLTDETKSETLTE